MAIGIKASKADPDYDLGASKFFGIPTVPLDWQEDFCEDEIFFCQIRLSDIAKLDKENVLPHTGYLYVFLHTDGGDRALKADVRYHSGEPSLAFEGFNTAVEGYERFEIPYLMEFYETDDTETNTRLFGFPSDWNYENAPPRMLMQYDPLDNDMGFLDHLDGFVYLFFGADENDLGAITLWEECS